MIVKGVDRVPKHLRAARGVARVGTCVPLWGRHVGEDAYVVGTGTSLAGFDFSRLAGRLTIALNDALLCPGLDPAYHLFHDTGIWVRYEKHVPHARTWFVCSKHARENFLNSEHCAFKSRVYYFEHAGAPQHVEPADAQLYVDRTIATAGIHMAWKLGAARIFLLGVDGYKVRTPEGTERYYWTGEPKTIEIKGKGRVPERRRKEKELKGGLVVQDRHDFWIENMRAAKRAFEVRKVYPCKWPGSGVYNLSALSMIDSWPKISQEEALA